MAEKKVYPQWAWPEFLMPPGGSRADPLTLSTFELFPGPGEAVRPSRTQDDPNP